MAWLGRMGRGAGRRLTLATALMCAAIPAGAAQAVERKLLVSSFEDIVVIGDIGVTLQTGMPVSATANADKETLDLLKLDRAGSTLRVSLKNISVDDKGRAFTRPLSLALTTPKIRNIVVSGNGRVSVGSIKQQDTTKIAISGGGVVGIGSFIGDRLEGNVDGNGQINIGSGKVRDSRITIIGAGGYRASGLESRTLRLEHNGNATSLANVSEKAEIYNRGSGSISIAGKGLCFIRMAGGAAINCAKTGK